MRHFVKMSSLLSRAIGTAPAPYSRPSARQAHIPTGETLLSSPSGPLRAILLALVLMVAPTAVAEGPSTDPDAARLVTTDIDNFWLAFEKQTPETMETVFQTDYLDIGSEGLKAFTALRISNAEKLADTVKKHPEFYRSIKETTLRVREFAPQMRASFEALQQLYKKAVFPDVYFMIGRMNSGGTITDTGLLIGVEMFALHDGMPDHELSDWHKAVLARHEKLPHIVAHELMHYQQSYAGKGNSLLSAVLTEGIADFVAERISGKHINHHLHTYANPLEQELWNEFKKSMQSDDYSAWLYNGNNAGDRPADLGYWMGYKIAESYFEHAADKTQAIHDMLEIEDFDAFLEASRYREKF